MSYELNKTYYWQHRPVVLKSIWMEDGRLYGAVSYTGPFRHGADHQVVQLERLQSVIKVRKKVNLTLKLLENNELQVEFVNYQVPEAEKELYYQVTFEVEVENNAQV
jgi:hypothetical protein